MIRIRARISIRVEMGFNLTRLTLPLSSRMSGTLRASASGVRSSWFAFTSAISSLRASMFAS